MFKKSITAEIGWQSCNLKYSSIEMPGNVYHSPLEVDTGGSLFILFMLIIKGRKINQEYFYDVKLSRKLCSN